jgi:hypothetical protein
MTTDFLLSLAVPGGADELLAISVKHQDELTNSRKVELLELEQAYWRSRGAQWLLLTPVLHDQVVATSVRYGLPWATAAKPVDRAHIASCAELANYIHGRPMRQALPRIGAALAIDDVTAQTVLWQSVWCGELPLNLSRPLRPDQPLELISREMFWRQNPIASRRSAWTR